MIDKYKNFNKEDPSDNDEINFINKKTEMINELDIFIKKFNTFTYEINPNNWGNSSSFYLNLTIMKKNIVAYTQITDKGIHYALDNDNSSELEQYYKNNYPGVYAEWKKNKLSIEFNI